MLLAKNPAKSKELANKTVDASGCGELNVDHAAKDSEGLACSSQSVNANFTPENTGDGNNSNGDELHDDDFSPKDLLRFAWQIARGMVNKVRLFFRASFERWLIIHIRCAGNKSSYNTVMLLFIRMRLREKGRFLILIYWCSLFISIQI